MNLTLHRGGWAAAIASMLYAAAFAAPFAYIPQPSGVSVIDVQTRAPVTTIPFSMGASRVIAALPDGPRAYVMNGTNELAVIDTRAQAMIGTIPLADFQANRMALNPRAPLAYLTGTTCQSCPPFAFEHKLRVLLTDNGGTLTDISLGSTLTTRDLVIDASGTRAYIGMDAGKVAVVDLQRNSLAASLD